MSIIKSDQDMQNLRYSARILASLMYHVRSKVKAGAIAGELNKFAEEFILDQGGRPSFKGLYGYPYSLITEVNDEVVHGMSGMDKILPDKSVVSLDCGVEYKGMYSDMCILMTIGEVSEDAKKLVEKTEESLWAGIKEVKPGKRIGDIGYAIDQVISKAGLGNVLDLGGHGIGYAPHTEPHIIHKGVRGKGAKLFENKVICIEPMVTLGSGKVIFEEVPGSGIEIVKSADGTLAAHIEHQILVTKTGYEVITEIKQEEVLN